MHIVGLTHILESGRSKTFCVVSIPWNYLFYFKLHPNSVQCEILRSLYLPNKISLHEKSDLKSLSKLVKIAHLIQLSTHKVEVEIFEIYIMFISFWNNSVD